LMVRVGVLADYRRPFWRMARQAIKRGQIDALFGVGFISYHLIEFSREALGGRQNASFYSARTRETIGMAAPPPAAASPARRSAQASVTCVPRKSRPASRA
jgi:hopanoid C-2 methylase